LTTNYINILRQKQILTKFVDYKHI